MKIGSGSFWHCFSPAGSLTPQTVPLLLVLLPARAGQVAAHHALDGQDLDLADQHAAALELLGVVRERLGQIRDLVGEQVVLDLAG